MEKTLVKHSKATYYKHRLDKAVDILKEIQELSGEFGGLDGLLAHGEQDLTDLIDKIGIFMEDIDDE